MTIYWQNNLPPINPPRDAQRGRLPYSYRKQRKAAKTIKAIAHSYATVTCFGSLKEKNKAKEEPLQYERDWDEACYWSMRESHFCRQSKHYPSFLYSSPWIRKSPVMYLFNCWFSATHTTQERERKRLDGKRENEWNQSVKGGFFEFDLN